MNNQIEEVKNKTDIVALIAEYIEVKKAGRNYKANCPFHGEKTPSFMITPELQMYKCFGCGRHGDCFTFIEEHEGMEFSEALKYLAEKAGVTLTLVKTEESSEKEKIINVNKNALIFYEYVLNDHPQGKKVLGYLKNERGLADDSIKQFKLGYSPESYNALSDFLYKKKKLNKYEVDKSNLLVGSGSDRFRGRVIFPLFDHRDNCIGFAGRVLPWGIKDTAKYINSPETAAYHKSKVLYGLNITKNYIRDSKFAIVVEGELDMISSYQAGIKNVIAIKGSALTEDQLRLIGRFCQKIVLCLDSDFAGNEAAKRGAILAINMNFEVKVALLNNFKDPDEAARKNTEEYIKSIDNSIDIWEFLITRIFDNHDASTGDGKSLISKEVVPLLRLISDNIVRSFYIESVARKLSVPIDAVSTEVNKIETTNIGLVSNNNYQKQEKSRRQLLEEKLIVNYIQNKKIFDKDIRSLISSEFNLKIIDFLNNNSFPLPKELEEKYSEMVLENSEEDDINLVTKELSMLDLKKKLEDLSYEIKKNENDENLLKKFSDLSKKLSAL